MFRTQFTASHNKLQQAVRDVTNQKKVLKQQCDRSKHKLTKLKSQHAQLETDYTELQVENLYLLKELEENQQQHAVSTDDHKSTASSDFSIAIKDGNRYTPEIRKLYYSLLSDQVPASKVEKIVKSVLHCFHPSVDTSQLHLPKMTCASYMRREELKTINDAQKATDYSTKQQGLFKA